MVKSGKRSVTFSSRDILAVSGGADSVYLLHRHGLSGGKPLVAHVNHGARGRESDEDMRFVEALAKSKNVEVRVKRATKKGAAGAVMAPGFEERARNLRYAYLKKLKAATGAKKILLAHTADDQVETVLMRVMEGAGISGLKGIPRGNADGIERPLLDTWRDEIVAYLGKHKISYRVDSSNFDTRFERNWVRHVLIPLLEKRYGKSVKKRIFTLGERFREFDEFLEAAARRWLKSNVRGLQLKRVPFGKLPAALRKKILQLVCFENVGVAPNERLLESIDRLIVSGGPSARLNVGKGAVIRNRYSGSVLEVGGKRTGKVSGKKREPTPQAPSVRMEEKGKISLGSLKRITKGEQASAFDRDMVALPLTVRPLRVGDRIVPFGHASEKKVKEIMIDRKIPADDRWGRPAVCDAEGNILWIPGVIRSAHAPVTSLTKRVVFLREVNPLESLKGFLGKALPANEEREGMLKAVVDRNKPPLKRS